MRLALAALLLIACNPEAQEGADPDLSRYALQADLDAALVEIDELREQVTTLTPATATADVTSSISVMDFDTEITVLAVRCCGEDPEGYTRCGSASYSVYVFDEPNAGAMRRLNIACSSEDLSVEVVYLPAAE